MNLSPELSLTPINLLQEFEKREKLIQEKVNDWLVLFLP